MIELNPSPSKVFSWLRWDSGILTVRYRYNGAEWDFYPVTEEEAGEVMNPGARYGFSIGSAFSQIIKSHKNGRLREQGQSQPVVATTVVPARRMIS